MLFRSVADWMVRPVNELVTAARRITAGDLSARVTSLQSRDEIVQRVEARAAELEAARAAALEAAE